MMTMMMTMMMSVGVGVGVIVIRGGIDLPHRRQFVAVLPWPVAISGGAVPSVWILLLRFVSSLLFSFSIVS